MNKLLYCVSDGCENSHGPGSIEILHNGSSIGFVCEECLGDSPGVRLTLKRMEETYEIGDVNLLNKVL